MSKGHGKKEVDALKRRIAFLRDKISNEIDPAAPMRRELHATTMAMIYLRACAGIDIDDLNNLLVQARRYAQSHEASDLAVLGQLAEKAMDSFMYRSCPECGCDERRTHKKKCSKFVNPQP